MNHRTEQELFWAGQFGDDYAARNKGMQAFASNISLFSIIMKRTSTVDSIIEFGANIGINLQVLRMIKPNAEFAAVEINEKAAGELEQAGFIKVYQTSILEFSPDYQRDLALIKGVLIHINPDKLTQIYDLLYQSSKRYICIAEYYNPTPVEVNYRGHSGKLFKRDFAGEILERHRDLRLVDYGFVYHNDPVFPQDDITWFLLEKMNG